MLAKLTFVPAFLAALAAAPAAAGSGPMYALQGGGGAVQGTTRFIAVGNHTANATELEVISTKDGTLLRQADLVGQWGMPATPAGAEGLSFDGRTLVLADMQSGFSSPSLFLVVDLRKMRIVRPITLHGYFAYDALSPDGSRLYLVQYTQGGSNDLSHYVVRAYDVTSGRLLPGRIADRTQKSWVMQGYPITRTWSADGRWAYTLYQNPGGYPFVHALDTVGGVAHCVGIPMKSQNGIYNIVLSLHGKTLSVHWRSGRPFVNVNTATWRVTPAHRGGFPWWALAFLALVPLAALGRRRIAWRPHLRVRPVPSTQTD
jgi:hypothetical protein